MTEEHKKINKRGLDGQLHTVRVVEFGTLIMEKKGEVFEPTGPEVIL